MDWDLTHSSVLSFLCFFSAHSFIFSLQDKVMNGSFTRNRSSWRRKPSVSLFRGHSRSSSYSSSFDNLKPVGFPSQIFLPETTVQGIPEEHRLVSRQHLRRSTSSDIRHPPKQNLSQRLSLDYYTLTRIDKTTQESIYKRLSRPARSSVKRRGHIRCDSMGNPYSIEAYDSESSFDSTGPSLYDGPITFTPEIDRRPLPKIPTELRQKMIEQARDSRRDVSVNQSRRRSRSHDPNLVTNGYLEPQFSFEIDPDIPGYRPAGRYKKHNPRERKVSSSSREFNIDNYNRHDEENNNVISQDGFRHQMGEAWNRDSNKQNSLRNRNREQKVINSILKNKPPNIRSISDTSGEGLRKDNNSASEVFVTTRDRSQSYGTAHVNVQTYQKPNTIYFYQTKL